MLSALGASMAHMTEAQRERVLAAATGIADEGARAVALTGIGTWIAQLGESNRRQLFDAAADLSDALVNARVTAHLWAAERPRWP